MLFKLWWKCDAILGIICIIKIDVCVMCVNCDGNVMNVEKLSKFTLQMQRTFEIVRKIKAFEALWLYRYYVIYILYFYLYHIVYIILSWQLHFFTMCNYPINRGYFTFKQCVTFLKCCGCVPLTHHQFFSNLPSHFHPFPHSFIIIF